VTEALSQSAPLTEAAIPTETPKHDPLEDTVVVRDPVAAMKQACGASPRPRDISECTEKARAVANDLKIPLAKRLEAVGDSLWVLRTILTDCAATPDQMCKSDAHKVELTVHSNGGMILMLELGPTDRSAVMAMLKRHHGKDYDAKIEDLVLAVDRDELSVARINEWDPPGEPLLVMGKPGSPLLAKEGKIGMLAFPLPQGSGDLLATIDRTPTYSPPKTAKVHGLPEPAYSSVPTVFTDCHTGAFGGMNCTRY
jgi:hypothetical protein